MLVGGAISDRISPRTLMLASNAFRAILTALLTLLVLLRRAQALAAVPPIGRLRPGGCLLLPLLSGHHPPDRRGREAGGEQCPAPGHGPAHGVSGPGPGGPGHLRAWPPRRVWFRRVQLRVRSGHAGADARGSLTFPGPRGSGRWDQGRGEEKTRFALRRHRSRDAFCPGTSHDPRAAGHCCHRGFFLRRALQCWGGVARGSPLRGRGDRPGFHVVRLGRRSVGRGTRCRFDRPPPLARPAGDRSNLAHGGNARPWSGSSRMSSSPRWSSPGWGWEAASST
jgi:hypothetical protein